MGPVFLVDFTLRLGAVLRRCNAVLCGGLGGVDAIGEKVRVIDLTVAEPRSFVHATVISSAPLYTGVITLASW